MNVFGTWRAVGGFGFDGDGDDVLIRFDRFDDDVVLGDLAVRMRRSRPRDPNFLVRDEHGADVADGRWGSVLARSDWGWKKKLDVRMSLKL